MADKYLVKTLPYAYDALSGISKETNTFHHDKHYAGYVAKNEIYESSNHLPQQIKRELLGVWELKRGNIQRERAVLHELFWEVLGNGKPNGEPVVKNRGGLWLNRQVEEDFKASALSALGCSHGI